jgi:hypothetical protein
LSLRAWLESLRRQSSIANGPLSNPDNGRSALRLGTALSCPIRTFTAAEANYRTGAGFRIPGGRDLSTGAAAGVQKPQEGSPGGGNFLAGDFKLMHYQAPGWPSSRYTAGSAARINSANPRYAAQTDPARNKLLDGSRAFPIYRCTICKICRRFDHLLPDKE